MTDAIRIVLAGEIVAKGRPRMTKTGFAFTPAKTRRFEDYVRHEAALVMQGKPMITDPVSMSILIELTPPESWSDKKKAQAIAGQIFPAKRPDMDNQIKACSDSLNKIVYNDDAQIVELSARKIYSTQNSAIIDVRKMVAA